MLQKVYEWDAISVNFTDGLILGNGASIAFDGRFSYKSLLEASRSKGLVGAETEAIFDLLKTNDFELVLRTLWITSQVNRVLDGASDSADAAYDLVRNALIEVVQSIHIAHESVRDQLASAERFMSHFKTVASLNYDLLVYWALLSWQMMAPNRFKDCFLADGTFPSEWHWMTDPFKPNTEATLVFYPHGNLALVTDVLGVDRKVIAEGVDLLTTIFAKWTEGSVTPLFVSEGTSEQKQTAIQRSKKLSQNADRSPGAPKTGDSPDFGLTLVRVEFEWRLGILR